jgi:hypothetical protein
LSRLGMEQLSFMVPVSVVLSHLECPVCYECVAAARPPSSYVQQAAQKGYDDALRPQLLQVELVDVVFKHQRLDGTGLVSKPAWLDEVCFPASSNRSDFALANCPYCNASCVVERCYANSHLDELIRCEGFLSKEKYPRWRSIPFFFNACAECACRAG